MPNLDIVKTYALPLASFGMMAATTMATTVSPNSTVSLALGVLGTTAGVCGCLNSIKTTPNKSIKELSLTALYGLTTVLGIYQIFMTHKQYQDGLQASENRLQASENRLQASENRLQECQNGWQEKENESKNQIERIIIEKEALDTKIRWYDGYILLQTLNRANKPLSEEMKISYTNDFNKLCSLRKEEKEEQEITDNDSDKTMQENRSMHQSSIRLFESIIQDRCKSIQDRCKRIVERANKLGLSLEQPD